MKGILLIHPFSREKKINFDVLIEKTWINKLLFKRISKIIDKKTNYISSPCSYVRQFLQESKKEYWHLGSDDLDHCDSEYNNKVIDDLTSLKLETVVIYNGEKEND